MFGLEYSEQAASQNVDLGQTMHNSKNLLEK